jgi:hypothetical protein
MFNTIAPPHIARKHCERIVGILEVLRFMPSAWEPYRCDSPINIGDGLVGIKL